MRTRTSRGGGGFGEALLQSMRGGRGGENRGERSNGAEDGWNRLQVNLRGQQRGVDDRMQNIR